MIATSAAPYEIRRAYVAGIAYTGVFCLVMCQFAPHRERKRICSSAVACGPRMGGTFSAAASRHEQEVISFYEASYALVAESLPHVDRVHRISLISRGIAAPGYTLQLPIEDRDLMTRSELLDRLTGLMGGRTARSLSFMRSPLAPMTTWRGPRTLPSTAKCGLSSRRRMR
jgi:hypothetical protein